MITVKDLNFASSLGVTFELKERHGHTTIQETFKMLESSDLDLMLEVLYIAYKRANKEPSLSMEEFVDLIEKKEIGFILLSEIYQQVVEALMFNGLSEREIAERKNALMNLQK